MLLRADCLICLLAGIFLQAADAQNCINTTCFELFSGALTFEEASMNCSDQGGSLAVARDVTVQTFLAELLLAQSDRSMVWWLGATETYIEDFLWADDSSLGTFSDWKDGGAESPETKRCIQIEYQSLKWISEVCHAKVGYICETASTSELECNVTQDSVFLETGDICYTIVYERADWFAAYANCKGQGGQLATVNTQDIHDRLTEALQGRGLNGFWIGLHSGQWRWLDGTSIENYFWKPGQPVSVDACLVLASETEPLTYLWTAEPCDKANAFICQNGPALSTTTYVEETTPLHLTTSIAMTTTEGANTSVQSSAATNPATTTVMTPSSDLHTTSIPQDTTSTIQESTIEQSTTADIPTTEQSTTADITTTGIPIQITTTEYITTAAEDIIMTTEGIITTNEYTTTGDGITTVEDITTADEVLTTTKEITTTSETITTPDITAFTDTSTGIIKTSTETDSTTDRQGSTFHIGRTADITTGNVGTDITTNKTTEVITTPETLTEGLTDIVMTSSDTHLTTGNPTEGAQVSLESESLPVYAIVLIVVVCVVTMVIIILCTICLRNNVYGSKTSKGGEQVPAPISSTPPGVIVRNSPQTSSMYLRGNFTTVNPKQWDWSQMPVEQARAGYTRTQRAPDCHSAVFVANEGFATDDACRQLSCGAIVPDTAANHSTTTASIHASLSSGHLSKFSAGSCNDDLLSVAGYSSLPDSKGKSQEVTSLSQRGFPSQDVTSLSSERGYRRQEVTSSESYLDDLYSTIVPKSRRHVSQVDASSGSFHGGASHNSQTPLIATNLGSIQPTIMDDSKFKTSIILK